jgi:hypothetical protein
MRLAIPLIAATIAIGQGAAAADAKNCILPNAHQSRTDLIVTCDVTNTGTVPIAEIGYRVVISQPNRTVPWIDKIRATTVPGGIEAGETINLKFFVDGSISERADRSALQVAITVIEAEDVNGQPIN